MHDKRPFHPWLLVIWLPLFWIADVSILFATYHAILLFGSLGVITRLVGTEIAPLTCSVWAGIELWRGRQNTIRMGKRLLVVGLFLSFLSALLWLVLMPSYFAPFYFSWAPEFFPRSLLRVAVIGLSMAGYYYFRLRDAETVREDRPGPQHSNATAEPGRAYDVYLSYRRSGGGELAQFVYLSLVRRGYRVFMDVRELGAGHFDDALLNTIDSTPDMVAVLTPPLPAQTDSTGEWFLRELEHAVATKRRVVPLRPIDSPPIDTDRACDLIPDLARHQVVMYSHEHADASIDRLCSMLSKPPQRQRRGFTLILGIGRRNVSITLGIAALSVLLLVALPRYREILLFLQPADVYRQMSRQLPGADVITPLRPIPFRVPTAPDAAYVTVTVRDSAGTLVRSLLQCRRETLGKIGRYRAARWDGTREDGTDAPDGSYVLVVAVDGKPETSERFEFRRHLVVPGKD